MLELAANVAFHRILYSKDVVSNSAIWNDVTMRWQYSLTMTDAVSLRDLIFH